jgi:hypothetical protein
MALRVTFSASPARLGGDPVSKPCLESISPARLASAQATTKRYVYENPSSPIIWSKPRRVITPPIPRAIKRPFCCSLGKQHPKCGYRRYAGPTFPHRDSSNSLLMTLGGTLAALAFEPLPGEPILKMLACRLPFTAIERGPGTPNSGVPGSGARSELQEYTELRVF